MINKLKKRIFWIIQGLLTIIIVIIVGLYVVTGYKDSVMSATMFMDKMSGNFNRPIDGYKQQSSSYEIDGIYNFTINNNGLITRKSDSSTTLLEQYAINASKKKSNEGIIGDYLYKVRKNADEDIHVTLMKNETIVKKIKNQIIYAILIGMWAIVILYFISNKISMIIIKPVIETIYKQKQFISDASHELKTPLAVIKANTEVLENKVGNNKWITYIQNEIQSMNKLVNDLLVLAKTKKISANNYEKFDISKYVEMTVSSFESMIYEKQIKLETNIQKDIIFNGDSEDIKRITSILIDNAIKHTNEKGKITVELLKEKNETLLFVRNEGEAIPKEEQEKIFERFYRVDKARNRNEKRYGLGLAIARQTVEKYKGTISVQCKNGITSFIVRI